MRAKKRTILLIAAALLISAFICYHKGVFSRKDVNVLLISMDTTRADRLGCYGYDKNTTPNIDSFAGESVLFKSAVAHVPFTFPSHLSIMTGTLPIYHGSHDNGGMPISDAHITLAEVLKEDGYKTGAILASYVLNAQFGLNQGFDTYTDFDDSSVGTTAFCNGRRAAETGHLAIEWIEENKEDKFFLFAHYYDPHFPYDPNEPFAANFKDPYDGEIASVDESVGRIMEKLKELGLYDDTLIIIVGDHGELLGEHEEAGHGYYIYEGAVKVPFIVKMPGSNRPYVVDDTVGLIDIFPTVCSMVGITVPEFIQGVDLCGYLKGKAEKKDRYIYTESMTATKLGGNSLLGVVSNRYKYIQTTRPELYDVARDPGEENNLIDKDPKRARLMQGNLKYILDSCAGIVDKEKSEVGLEARRQLESLGYIGGEVDASLSFDQTKPDPKDLLYQYNMLRKIMNDMVLEDFKSAGVWLDKLSAERPDLELVQKLTAKLWLAKVQHEPDKAKAYEEIADMFFKLKEYDRAIKNWNEVLKLGVDTAELRKKLAAANIHLKNAEEAIEHLEISLKMKPDQADVNLTLGEIFSGRGDSDEAIKYWAASVEIDPSQAKLYDKLGAAYYQKGAFYKVLEHWTKAAELRADDAQILNNLAWLHSAIRDSNVRNPKKALEYALRACELTDYGQANFVDTLAVAYAANGQFSRAIETALKALDLAVSAGRENLVDEINKRLELYKARQPYYDL
jgi:arylsulfatase A-like enzyme/lipopolysaccharide biosynthesis regulator YciM